MSKSVGGLTHTKYKHTRIGGRSGPMKLYHIVLWESINGPVPEGHQVHHIDGNRSNNDLENLQLVSHLEHQRIHSPYYVKLDGVWTRFCKYCKEINKVFREKSPTCNDCRARLARIDRRKTREGRENINNT